MMMGGWNALTPKVGMSVCIGSSDGNFSRAGSYTPGCQECAMLAAPASTWLRQLWGGGGQTKEISMGYVKYGVQLFLNME